jgi:hypothetical protein
VEVQQRLRHDLDALAITGLPEQIRASVRAASRSALRRLDTLLWQPIRDAVGDGPLLLAPSARLATVAWPLLPALRGRPVTVVASVSAWLAARDRVPLPEAPSVALAAGPAVPRADEEVRSVAKVWDPLPSTMVTTAGAVRAAAATADVLHVAAHGRHEPDNPLLSHLDLADGPLFGYELERLPRLPRHIVLSACELGLSGSRPGDETLGMTAALLHAGAGSVVAGVARVGDAAARQVAPAHHAGLRAGHSPARALAAALDAVEDPPPLVCFGAGW